MPDPALPLKAILKPSTCKDTGTGLHNKLGTESSSSCLSLRLIFVQQIQDMQHHTGVQVRLGCKESCRMVLGQALDKMAWNEEHHGRREQDAWRALMYSRYAVIPKSRIIPVRVTTSRPESLHHANGT